MEKNERQMLQEVKADPVQIFRKALNGDLTALEMIIDGNEDAIQGSIAHGVIVKTMQKGDVKSLKKVLTLLSTHNIDISASDSSGRTALHEAARMLDVERIEVLLSFGASTDKEAEGGRTPLHYAASADFRGHYKFDHLSKIIELLLKAGADINARDDRGKTPLYDLISMLHTGRHFDEKAYQILEMMVAKGADPFMNIEGRTPMLIANAEAQEAMKRGGTTIPKGVSQGDIMLTETALPAWKSGFTPEELEVVESILDCQDEYLPDALEQVDRSFMNKLVIDDVANKLTLLGLAMSESSQESPCRANIVNALIDAGAKIDLPFIKTNDKLTALAKAIDDADFLVFTLLLSKGADVEANCEMEFTFLLRGLMGNALHRCARNLRRAGSSKTPPMMLAFMDKILERHPEIINSKDSLGNTALGIIVDGDHRNTEITLAANLLLRHGARGDIKNKTGKSVLELAEECWERTGKQSGRLASSVIYEIRNKMKKMKLSESVLLETPQQMIVAGKMLHWKDRTATPFILYQDGSLVYGLNRQTHGIMLRRIYDETKVEETRSSAISNLLNDGVVISSTKGVQDGPLTYFTTLSNTVFMGRWWRAGGTSAISVWSERENARIEDVREVVRSAGLDPEDTFVEFQGSPRPEKILAKSLTESRRGTTLFGKMTKEIMDELKDVHGDKEEWRNTIHSMHMTRLLHATLISIVDDWDEYTSVELELEKFEEAAKELFSKPNDWVGPELMTLAVERGCGPALKFLVRTGARGDIDKMTKELQDRYYDLQSLGANDIELIQELTSAETLAALKKHHPKLSGKNQSLLNAIINILVTEVPYEDALKVIERILAAGGDPNEPDSNGSTALHCLAKQYRAPYGVSEEIFKAVLDAGGDPTIPNAKDITALDMIEEIESKYPPDRKVITKIMYESIAPRKLANTAQGDIPLI